MRARVRCVASMYIYSNRRACDVRARGFRCYWPYGMPPTGLEAGREARCLPFVRAVFRCKFLGVSMSFSGMHASMYCLTAYLSPSLSSPSAEMVCFFED